MGQVIHDMIAAPTRDEAARQDFVYSFLSHVRRELWPGHRKVFEAAVKPRLGKDASTRGTGSDLARAMRAQPHWQMASALRVVSQEVLWDTYGEKIARHLPDLTARARRYRDSNRKLGSLRLSPDLVVPRYHTAVDIHMQPGGYHVELQDDDVFEGALFDDAMWTFRTREGGPLNENSGHEILAFLRARYPDLAPRRILDMGCTAGNSTLAYVDSWPVVEVHGIDVAAPCLRYAHARAEALGKAVHFSQQNAETTDFPAGHFDLVVSRNMLHETSHAALPRIFRETHRLLAPGGVFLHLDMPSKQLVGDDFDRFMRNWDAHYNAEPYIPKLIETDQVEVAVAAGFNRAQVAVLYIPEEHSLAPAGMRRVRPHVAVGRK